MTDVADNLYSTSPPNTGTYRDKMRGRRQHDACVPSAARQDRQLVDRCLRGEVAAWDLLYTCCHPSLLVSIRSSLGGKSDDLELVEEIAARVWFRVVGRGTQLLARYDPDRDCRLTTYLSGFARNEVRAYLRSEQRRRDRETRCAQAVGQADAELTRGSRLLVEELLATLSKQETEFLAWCLAPVAARESGTHFSNSANNDDQIRYRLRRKIARIYRT